MKENNFNKTFDKKEIKKLANWFLINYGSLKTLKLLESLKYIGFEYSTKAGISLSIEDLKIPRIKENLFYSAEKDIEKNLNKYEKGKINVVTQTEKTIKIWNSINEILKNEVINNFRQTNILNPLYMMTSSGARGNISQIRQLVGMRGLMADSKGELINIPIKNNFKEGLSLSEYFISCYGARKGLIDTALKTANSGYLTRRLVYSVQNQTIRQVNCKTRSKNIVHISEIKNKQDFERKKEQLIGRVIARDLIEKETKKKLAGFGQDICNYLIKKIYKQERVFILSPLTCKSNKGFCQLCYGWNLGNGRMAELGESVGVIAAQSLGEPGTQLTMRTFHTGGVFTGEVKKSITAPYNGRIFYKNLEDGKKVYTKYQEKAFLTLKEKKLIIYDNKIKKSIITLPKNSIIFPRPKEKIYEKQIIAEIIENTEIKKKEKRNREVREVKANFSGQLHYGENQKKNKKKLYIFSGNIVPFRKLKKIIDLENRSLKKEKIKENSRQDLQTYKIRINFNKIKLFQKTHLIHEKYNIQKVFGDTKQIMVKKRKTEKILSLKDKKVKINQIFYKNEKVDQASRNRYSYQIIQKRVNNIIIRKTRSYIISGSSKINIRNLYPIKKNNILFFLNYQKKKTEDIVQGLPKIEEILEAKKTSNLENIENNPHDILKKNFTKFLNKYTNAIATRKSIEKTQKYLIMKVQSVYKSQGIKISDKHLEVIIKQMTSKVIIRRPGNSNLITGEIIELNRVERMNKKLSKKEKKILYEPLLLGISKISLSNQSFISQASFQETTKVLTRSAIEGKIDWLWGLKENLVLGNLIPAGTGYQIKKRGNL
jgi:DNA-directed RNA polymerase subunit beta'